MKKERDLRGNVKIVNRKKEEVRSSIANWIKNNFPRSSGIIYCLSRDDTEKMAKRLYVDGISSAWYHAGLTKEKRISKIIKVAAIGMAGGMMFHSAACLNTGGFAKLAGPFAQGALEHAAYEFVLDNDSVFDLFQDDFGTGTQYDDRFTAEPTREEVE